MGKQVKSLEVDSVKILTGVKSLTHGMPQTYPLYAFPYSLEFTSIKHWFSGFEIQVNKGADIVNTTEHLRNEAKTKAYDYAWLQ